MAEIPSRRGEWPRQVALAALLGASIVGSATPASALPAFPQRVLPSKPPTPAARAEAFYRWYLHGMRDDRDPQTDDSTQFATYITVARRRALYRDRDAGSTDVDYFTKAQDVLETWADSIAVRTRRKTATEATVEVTLGSASERQRLRVLLQSVRGVWRISRVTEMK
jgi:hypothetical protein